MRLSATQQRILDTAVNMKGGMRVTLPNGRRTSRMAMEGLRTLGLVVYEVREGWAGNWLTAAGLQEIENN